MKNYSKSGRKVFFTVLLCCLIGVLLGWQVMRRPAGPSDLLYRQILTNFLWAQPVGASVSPDGRYRLQKAEDHDQFIISVVDQASGKLIASNSSPYTQRSLTWRPDGQAIAFQESVGLDRLLYLLQIESGTKIKPDVPLSRTALPPLRWVPNGNRLVYFEGDWRSGQLLVINPGSNLPPVTIANG